MQTFARWVTTPENRAAQLAVEHVAECVSAGRSRRLANPLYLAGPAGIGKSHLASALADRVARQALGLVVTVLEARDLGLEQESDAENSLAAARQADLLVIENIHQLREAALETLIQLLDARVARLLPTVVTATAGPARLTNLPQRITSRLAAGLVVELDVLTIPSRLAFLRDRASRRQLAIEEEVIVWLAEHAGGSPRQLQGAINRVEALAKAYRQVPGVELVATHFQAELEAKRPSVDRIVRHVSSYFRVAAAQLQSRRRYRHALLPRQVGMYLARQLTDLSLEQIGAQFGGRDHSTVLHACRKVKAEAKLNATLGAALRQLHADLA
jgi:chromosomal replication initiator protein